MWRWWDAGRLPQTVLNVLSAFDPNVKGHNIDLSKTYTNDFVTKADQTYK